MRCDPTRRAPLERDALFHEWHCHGEARSLPVVSCGISFRCTHSIGTCVSPDASPAYHSERRVRQHCQRGLIMAVDCFEAIPGVVTLPRTVCAYEMSLSARNGTAPSQRCANALRSRGPLAEPERGAVLRNGNWGRSEGRATSSQTEREEVRCRKTEHRSHLITSAFLPAVCCRERRPNVEVGRSSGARGGHFASSGVRGISSRKWCRGDDHPCTWLSRGIASARFTHGRLCSEPLHNKAKTSAIRSLPSLSPDPHPAIPKTQASSANTQRPNS